MEKAAMWQVIDDERAGLADLLASLTEEQWTCPSLCEGWTVREVAAHLSSGPRARLVPILIEAVRARGSFNRMVDNTARREAARPPVELVAALQAASGSRHLAPGQKLAVVMMDVLVHGQDIAIPLGIDRPMPLEAARYSAEHTWRMGFPFRARKRLRGFRLVATDVPWSSGEGAEINGPIADLLLLVSGRHAALSRLTGPGAAVLRARALADR
ncbi:maleylpyruvate isomerase family mycothiol-dependent enzyme [Streptomyces sp. HC44]|uniref:Maleylpyruvate isomerase family mycothiol-dependent enzyme n=1 Tax=Streptomyces scabichelini TaxID=2711217 RepID=A0A6G4VLZ7_9ACTN|nr:maleylpyruvate isomerase family mycothiol-dependent enzyme [Streptomyces scabichelini]NGO15208.1 maleylpyruvate isomerase family mycothiol-dependent enzyme [Streptomyces scabichelini]